MQLLPMSKLGPRETAPNTVQLGLFLPWVSAADGNGLSVKIIHEADQFLQDVPPLEFPLTHSIDPAYGDCWSTEVVIDLAQRPTPDSAWGTPGTYVYRYQLSSPLLGKPLDWIVDPFAREFGIGKLSAFTLGFADHAWSAAEASWKTPRLSQLIVYELMLHEFSGGLRAAMERLPYLADLGINCIEVMPISNVEATLNWGFEPIGFFGVDERFGNRADFQAFVDEAHRHGIAVILDVVYGHTGAHFPYEYVYSRLGYHENPFMGSFGKDMFGPSTDWSRPFVRDYFFTVNDFWLDKCHVDGFRYDCVPNYWDGPAGVGYANLAYHTYQKVRSRDGAGHWARFSNGGELTLIQCAEQLEDPKGIVWTTYSNATWQNETLSAAAAVAHGDYGRLYGLGMSLGLDGYPDSVTHDEDVLPKTAFQYIESHDHSRFLVHFGIVPGDDPLFDKADRSQWYKVQPYLIALFTARGVPMLWQGQELGADNVVPDRGFARIGVLRPMPWELFYDGYGRGVLTLVRRLTRLRAAHVELQTGAHYFYNDWDRYQSKGALLFSRYDANRLSLVALNFSDQDLPLPFAFDRAGQYTELLHGEDNFQAIAGEERSLFVPRHYGRIWRVGS
ncbi:MAG TPA: alpha-amylase family glycosyl hydrolase [Gammaproteobacteria bacterium]